MIFKKISTVLVSALFVFGTLQGCSSESKVDDATINQNIQSKIASDETLASQNIQVETKDGVVTLTGTVDDRILETKAITLSQSVEGVKSVDSRIMIKPPQSVAAPKAPAQPQPSIQPAPVTPPAPAQPQVAPQAPAQTTVITPSAPQVPAETPAQAPAQAPSALPSQPQDQGQSPTGVQNAPTAPEEKGNSGDQNQPTSP